MTVPARVGRWGAWVALVAAACAGAREPEMAAGDLRFSHLAAWSQPGAEGATAGWWMRNAGAAADTLVGVSAASARAMVHESAAGAGMRPVAAVPLPAGAEVRLGRGALHVMVEGLAPLPAPGDTLALVLHFRRAGDVTLRVPVLRYSEAVDRLGS